MNGGARPTSERQTIAPARYDEGTIATSHNAATGERDNIPLAHAKGRIRRFTENSGENRTNPENSKNEWIEHAALHNPLPHFLPARL